jgi:hypothetical protein
VSRASLERFASEVLRRVIFGGQSNGAMPASLTTRVHSSTSLSAHRLVNRPKMFRSRSQSSVILADCARSRHCTISFAIKAAKLSAVPPTGSMQPSSSALPLRLRPPLHRTSFSAFRRSSFRWCCFSDSPDARSRRRAYALKRWVSMERLCDPRAPTPSPTPRRSKPCRQYHDEDERDVAAPHRGHGARHGFERFIRAPVRKIDQCVVGEFGQCAPGGRQDDRGGILQIGEGPAGKTIHNMPSSPGRPVSAIVGTSGIATRKPRRSRRCRSRSRRRLD